MNTENTNDQNNNYVVVIRAGSRLRFASDEQLSISLDGGSTLMTFQTRYIDEGFETHVPRDMWIDVRGSANSIKEAVTAFTNSANFFCGLVSLCSNGYAGDVRYHLAYDNTSGKTERDFFEQFVENERGAPTPSRLVKPNLVTKVVEGLSHHQEYERLIRAIAQYVVALKYWSKGDEIFSVAHLFMGMEALIPVIKRNEIGKLNLNNDQDLAKHLNVEKKNLDGTIRRKFLFEDDQEFHKKVKQVSDGFEHGFAGFDEIRHLAIETRDRTASNLRIAIIELLDLPSEITHELFSAPYDKPIGTEGYIRYLYGKLSSSNDDLAQEGDVYPIVDWNFTVSSYKVTDDNKIQISFSEQFTPRIGENVSIIIERREIFGPEGIISDGPKEQKIEPTITPKVREFKNMSPDELQLVIQEELKDGKLEEIRIRTKNNKLLIINPGAGLKEED